LTVPLYSSHPDLLLFVDRGMQLWSAGEQSLRGGICEVVLAIVFVYVVVSHVFRAIAAARHGIFLDPESTLVHEPVMARAQQHQVFKTGLSAC
jgi:hypothetical protein